MTTVVSNLKFLHPLVIPVYTKLADELVRSHKRGETRTLFKVFETYRHPQRQAEVLAAGHSKAGPFSSAHQYGLAVDFVPFIAGRWSWDNSHDYEFLAKTAENMGLGVPYDWDKVHVEHPDFTVIRQFVDRALRT